MKTLFVMICTAALLNFQSQEADRAPQDAESGPQFGRITGDSVNVRSGPSTNFYPVTRVGRDTQVRVYEVQHGWARIAPPAGVYSLIARQYVDPDGNDRGVVNGERVWVHPGSDLVSGPYYAKQLQLNLGQSVRILGELDDYYKIEPPIGASVWISADYLEILDEAVASQAAVQRAQARAEAVPAPPSDEDITDVQHKSDIELIEADLQEEFKKDVLQRNFQSFIERFEPIASQEEDYPAQQYAIYRISQLRKAIQRVEALQKMQKLSSEVERKHREFLRQRADIRVPAAPIEQDFDVRGKLIRSFAYDSPVGPQRMRLIDPDSPTAKTVGYVEFEPDSGIDPAMYLGRFVGVRAKDQRLIKGSVDAVVVYTVAELVVLEQQSEKTQDHAQAQPGQ